MFTDLHLKNFAAFSDFRWSGHGQINVVVGENDTEGFVRGSRVDTNAIFLPPKEVLTIFAAIEISRSKYEIFGFDDTYYDLLKLLRIPTSRRQTAIRGRSPSSPRCSSDRGSDARAGIPRSCEEPRRAGLPLRPAARARFSNPRTAANQKLPITTDEDFLAEPVRLKPSRKR